MGGWVVPAASPGHPSVGRAVPHREVGIRALPLGRRGVAWHRDASLALPQGMPQAPPISSEG